MKKGKSDIDPPDVRVRFLNISDASFKATRGVLGFFLPLVFKHLASFPTSLTALPLCCLLATPCIAESRKRRFSLTLSFPWPPDLLTLSAWCLDEAPSATQFEQLAQGQKTIL